MIARRGSAKRWTPDKVYELFPRLGERKRNGGAQLSGGEQQMLAIGRALLTNPSLLVMDEPSEGLAPAIIEQLIETFKALEQEGLAILLIEQNLGMATSVADRQVVMVAGSIAAETTADALNGDAELQRRYLGVEPLAERRLMARVVLLGTLDTKGHEYAYLREQLAGLGVDVTVVDAGTHEPVGLAPDVSHDEVARAAGADVAALAAAGDRGAAVTAMAEGAERVVLDLHARGELDGDSCARRLRRLVDRGARDAGAARRGAEAARLDRRVRRHAAVRRRGRRDDDVLGRRHLRRSTACRHGSSRTPPRRSPGWRRRRRRRSTAGRSSPRRCSASRRRASRERASGSRSSATRCSSSTPRARAAGRWRRSSTAASSPACST